ncbi:MAG: NrtA/SsuA/CpmA family ABC transporter substrate-binding protein [Alphaproteobacteria bacterium]|nr:NrtA/SsuA/CpmA family ABC transporter substrate-binding protein [Alphaproteobacteria bacterium]MBV9862750.1 NrtA/SsuA/CpmA family ABC transporter substrate-binding protein [Alphaproteobacteria bacterium]
MTLTRRSVLAAALAVPGLRPAAILAGEPVTVRVGALKLIHSITPWFYERFLPDGYRLEIVPFESPTDGKSAVVTRSVDFGTFGVAAAILGAAAHEPVVVFGSSCNKGMAVVARKDSPVDSIRDLKGRRVAIWPGSTQEVFILERLRMEGMSVHDIEPVRVSFSEMPAALARRDVEAYVGAEPGPGLSISSGIGKIVEYPYSTAMGSLNMILAAHRDVLAEKPDLAGLVLRLQKQASEFAMAHPDEMIATTVAKLGMKKDAVAASVGNVELNWQMTPNMREESRTYAEHMLELKQIRAMPDFATFMDPRFSDDLAHAA